MPIQANLQWTDFLLCPICQHDFSSKQRFPISLGCGHTICRLCLATLQRKQCPLDQATITTDPDFLPVNQAILQLVPEDKDQDKTNRKLTTSSSESNDESNNNNNNATTTPDDPTTTANSTPTPTPIVASSLQKLSADDLVHYNTARQAIEKLALYLKPYLNGSTNGTPLSRPMLRKLVTLVNCQLVEDEGRARSLRAARSLGERTVTELILQHQNPQQLSTNLWAAVRARGCQFLGPAMQEEVLKLVLSALQDGSALSRKVLVMYVVQRLEPHFHQASKTSIGHVVQLLYRASCFKVSKREGDSSLMQLKEEYRTYEALRREHDAQIVQIATEAGLRIAPDQWSSLLYGDPAHKSHMQSIIDKLQTPQSFEQSVQELVIALQRTGDPAHLSVLRTDLKLLAGIDPTVEGSVPTWNETALAMEAVYHVVQGLVEFVQHHGGTRKLNESNHLQNSKYKISFCRDLKLRGTCPRAGNCTFAHTEDELERYRAKIKKLPLRATASTPKEIEYLVGEQLVGRGTAAGSQAVPPYHSSSTSSTNINMTEELSPMRLKGRGFLDKSSANNHPPLFNHLSLPANPVAAAASAYPGSGSAIPPPPTRFQNDFNFPPRPPPVVVPPPPVIRNMRPYQQQQNPPQQSQSMFKSPLSISPSAPPQFVNDMFSGNNFTAQQNQQQQQYSQANLYLKQLQNAHDYPLDRLDQRKMELMRQLLEYEQQQQQQQQQQHQLSIPNKAPIKSTQSLPMFPTSPQNNNNKLNVNLAMHLQSLVNRRQEILREIETRKEEDLRTKLAKLDLFHETTNGNYGRDIDFWNFNSHSSSISAIDAITGGGGSGSGGGGNGGSGNNNNQGPKDTFVRSDSILDDDYIPFETPTTAISKFGPISRMPSNSLSKESSSFSAADDTSWLFAAASQQLQQQQPTTSMNYTDNLLPQVPTTINNNHHHQQQQQHQMLQHHKKFMVDTSLYLKRISENNKLQLELTQVDRKIAGLKLANQQQQQQHHQQQLQQQQTGQQQQQSASNQQVQYPQKRKLTRLVAGITPTIDPLLPVAVVTSAVTSTQSPSNNPTNSSQSLFWSNADIKSSAVSSASSKLWNNELKTKDLPGNIKISSLTSSAVAAAANDDALDDEGIANGIREIEMRFENELDEQEKLWPRSDHDGLTQEF